MKKELFWGLTLEACSTFPAGRRLAVTSPNATNKRRKRSTKKATQNKAQYYKCKNNCPSINKQTNQLELSRKESVPVSFDST
jgi:hypothetical protein